MSSDNNEEDARRCGNMMADMLLSNLNSSSSDEEEGDGGRKQTSAASASSSATVNNTTSPRRYAAAHHSPIRPSPDRCQSTKKPRASDATGLTNNFLGVNSAASVADITTQVTDDMQLTDDTDQDPHLYTQEEKARIMKIREVMELAPGVYL